MSDTDLSVSIRPKATHDPDIDHIVCCVNADVTLCGLDASAMPYVDFEEPSCVVCADLEGCGGFCPLAKNCEDS